MSSRLKLAIAAALVTLIAAVVIHGFGGETAGRAQDKLEARAQASLYAVGASDWARVEMDGQRAVLSGLAPTENDVLAARGAVRTAVWAGGPLIGGVSVVDSSDVRVAPLREGPYAWSAELGPDAVRLGGAATSFTVIRELGVLAGALFPEHEVVNDLGVDPFPPGDGWPEAARGGLVVLSHMTSGVAELEDFELVVAGEAASAEDAHAARASLSRLGDLVSAASRVEVRAALRPEEPPEEMSEAPPEPASAVAPIHVLPPGTSFEAMTPEDAAALADALAAEDDPDPVNGEPEAASVRIATLAPDDDSPAAESAAEECQRDIDAVLAESPILFAPGSADIDGASAAALEAIAAILASYEPLSARVEGHTDDTGAARWNQTLSELRAAAVVDRLADLGVDRARLTFAGVGPARPVADNATPEGRRANRRIEITVLP